MHRNVTPATFTRATLPQGASETEVYNALQSVGPSATVTLARVHGDSALRSVSERLGLAYLLISDADEWVLAAQVIDASPINPVTLRLVRTPTQALYAVEVAWAGAAPNRAAAGQVSAVMVKLMSLSGVRAAAPRTAEPATSVAGSDGLPWNESRLSADQVDDLFEALARDFDRDANDIRPDDDRTIVGLAIGRQPDTATTRVERSPEQDDAFTELVSSSSALMFAYASRLAKSREEAEELVQMAYYRLYVAWPEIPSTSAARALMIHTMRRESFDLKRRHARRWQLTEAVPPAIPVEDIAIARADAQQTVLAAWTNLTDAERTVVNLMVFQGQPTAEIARILNMSSATVHQHFLNARYKLLDQLSAPIQD
jgi:RNA polymerase sigma-70 factor (ECF subfamily)